MPKRADIYSITGMFNEPDNSRSGIFGGWFALRNSQELEASLRGMLVDPHGSSEIFGTLSPHALKFEKKYSSRTYNVSYNFDKNENGIWLGTYNFNDLEGKAVCKIEKNWENILIISPESISPDQWANDLVASMLAHGILKTIKDKKTGREVIIPG